MEKLLTCEVSAVMTLGLRRLSLNGSWWYWTRLTGGRHFIVVIFMACVVSI
jgi:hypothetical protein